MRTRLPSPSPSPSPTLPWMMEELLLPAQVKKRRRRQQQQQEPQVSQPSMCQVPYHEISNKQQPTANQPQSKNTVMEETSNFMLLLEYAADNDIERFTLLVEQGALIDSSRPWYCRQYGSKRMAIFDRTPAMVAALYGSMDVLNYVLRQGANVNMVCGTDGNTALHSAAASGLPNTSQIVNLLLSHGADPNILNAQGSRPLDIMSGKSSAAKQAAQGYIATSGNELISPDSSHQDDITDLLSEASLVGSEDHHCASQICDSTSLQILTTGSSSGSGDAISDIKNIAYTTDEFRIYSFKVRPCSRAYSHDWTDCPFAHPGENARRRDPRKYKYSCVPCSDFRRGSSCKYGDDCEYAHGVFETWLHPAQYRTRMCKDAANCTRRVCFFAHSEEQLRSPAEQSEDSSPRVVFPMDANLLSPQQGSPVFSPKRVQSPPGITLCSSKSMHEALAQTTIPGLNLLGGTPSSGSGPSMNARDLITENGRLPFDMDSQACMNAANCVSRPGGYQLNFSCSPGHEDFYNAVSPKSPLQMYLLSSNPPTGDCKRFGHNLDSTTVLTKTQLHPDMDHQVLAQLQQVQEERRRSMTQPQSPIPYPTKANHYASYGKGNQFQHPYNPLLPTGKRSLSSRNLERALAWSDWGSPTGKPEWGVSGDDLNKFRKSISFKDKPLAVLQ